ncbi:MLL4 [Mytilus coruscus]|uniref:MLL4 n=1 Tax=Mytilus coruscus TaxID=42192 RepID=A0A6J8BCU0_MYTCO|nr:MLL4 [Mytilus coruscus]
MVVERSMSVALASNPSEQHYRINMCYTTCRLEINGRHAEQFIQELKTTEQPNQNLQNLNEITNSKCQEYLQQKNPATSINQTNRILVKVSATSVYNNGANNQCPKCNHWVHFSCDKLKKEEITLLESKPEDSPYTCKLCQQRTTRLTSTSNSSQPPEIPNRTEIFTLTDNYTSDKQEVKANYSKALVIATINERDFAADILNEQIDTRDPDVRLKQKSSDLNEPIHSTAKTADTIVTADDSNPLMIANSLKDIQAPKQIELSNREMRQKEIRLKKKEDGIKISKKEAEDCKKDNARLKSLSEIGSTGYGIRKL